jgi:aspartate carbamoyltransferase regulatory subunit
MVLDGGMAVVAVVRDNTVVMLLGVAECDNIAVTVNCPNQNDLAITHGSTSRSPLFLLM